MDGHDEARESSLPRSLIPHLYRHPPSSTRTTLYEDPPHRPPAPRSPPYALPPLPLPPRTAWGEGEPGPSSLPHHPLPPRDHTYRRAAASLSPRLTPHPDPFARPPSIYDHDAAFADSVRRDPERDPSYLILPGHPVQSHHAQAYYPQQSYQSNDLVLPPDVDDSHFSFRHDPYPPYLSVANLSLHTPSPTHFRRPGSTEGGSGSYAYRSDSYTTDHFTSNDEGPPRPNKRQRAESVQENTPRKQSTPRKTAVACNFCRGRKLRCNGARPACSHCTARKINCEYVSTPKRRGPGKAAKGSRSKKAGASRPDPSGSSSNNNTSHINATSTADRPSSAVLPAYELAAQAPEMRPYTHVMSLDTLDTFSFQPPAPAPRYPSGADPEMMMMREYYSRGRSPRRRETSSEDRSGAERE